MYAHLERLFVDVDPTNFQTLFYMRITATLGSYPRVVEVSTRSLQSSRHVPGAELRYIALAHSAPASFFTNIVYSCSTNILTCFFLKLFSKPFPSQVSASLIRGVFQCVYVRGVEYTGSASAGASSHRLFLPVTSEYSISMCRTYPPAARQFCRSQKAQLDGQVREFGKCTEGDALSATSFDSVGRSAQLFTLRALNPYEI